MALFSVCTAALFLTFACESDRDPEATRPAPTAEPSSLDAPIPLPPGDLFADVTAASGLDFVHDNGAEGDFYMPESMSGGGALADLDGDGDLDLFLVQGGRLAPGADPGPAGDRVFRNDLARAGGALRFTDVTAGAGAWSGGYGMGAAAGDFDNDGRVDLYVTRLGADVLLRNVSSAGAIRFEEVPLPEPAGEPRWSVPAVAADLDADGWLDLFAGSYLDWSFALHRDCKTPAGVPDYCAPEVFEPLPDRLLRNRGAAGRTDGGGWFEDVSQVSGIAAAEGKALGAVAADLDGDGRTDLYVANDGTPNHLWLQREPWRFTEDALFSGSAVSADGEPEASMGVAVGDVDLDGRLDLLLSHLTGETHTLYRGDGQGGFEDVTTAAGLAAPSLAATGFGAGLLDLDLDGILDLYVANGAVRAVEALVREGDPYPYHQRDQLFRGLPGGRFEEVTERAGPALAPSRVGRGVLFGDLDQDGDTDLVLVDNGAPTRVLLDRVGQERPWLGLRLALPVGGGEGGDGEAGGEGAVRLGEGGRESGDEGGGAAGGSAAAPAGAPLRDALGAVATLHRPGLPPLVRRAATDGSYAAAGDPRVVFGLGEYPEVDRVEVRWPDGSVETWSGGELPLGRYTTLVEGTGTASPDGD